MPVAWYGDVGYNQVVSNFLININVLFLFEYHCRLRANKIIWPEKM